MRTPLTTWAISGSFLDLGLELEGEGSLEGAWLDKLVGLNDVKTSLAFFRVPDGQGIGQANIELVKYHRPPDENGIQELPANTLGIRHIAFAVEDIEAVVARLKEKGTETFSEIYDYEGMYKFCYIRGHERSGGGHHSRVGRADQLERGCPT